jgi:macrocin-O-methyltransferase TylF-like protien
MERFFRIVGRVVRGRDSVIRVPSAAEPRNHTAAVDPPVAPVADEPTLLPVVDEPPAAADPPVPPIADEPALHPAADEPAASADEPPAHPVSEEPRLQHLPHLPVRYEGRREPSAFRFQDPASFLFGREVTNWTYSERAPFYTEHDLEGRFRFMQNAAAYLFGAGISGDYHEYGCYSANTFRMFLTWSAIYKLQISKYWAFDSFQGLPAPDEGVSLKSWKPGTMRMSEDEFRAAIAAHGVLSELVSTVPGFYNDSLTAALQKKFIDHEERIAFVNVDCDLFTSAVSVFNFIEPLLQEGSLIYLDDYFVGYRGSPKKGVAGAFWQFVDGGRWNVQEFHTVGAWGKSFIVYPK